MSIYATYWILKFPKFGDAHYGCEWINVFGQGVPGHIGTPTESYGYESGDPYANFLPPPIPVADDDAVSLRAMVIIRDGTEKVGQEYIAPLLIMSGEEYLATPFQSLHDRICDALRGRRPRVIAELFGGAGDSRVVFEDGSIHPPLPDEG